MTKGLEEGLHLSHSAREARVTDVRVKYVSLRFSMVAQPQRLTAHGRHLLRYTLNP